MAADGYALHLLGGLELTHESRVVPLPPAAGRLAGFLACNGGGMRGAVAEMLWPELREGRALANLRSALWRLQLNCPDLVEACKRRVRLATGVRLDVSAATNLAFALIEGRLGVAELRSMNRLDWAPLMLDVLPDYYDEWAVVERERFRQLRLHALDELGRAFTAGARYAEAIDVAGAAIRAEPLRESSHRVLIAAHLHEGNRVEAMRAYERCVQLLETELGVAPTTATRSLIARLPAATR